MAYSDESSSTNSTVKTVLTYLFGFISGLVVVIVFYPTLNSYRMKPNAGALSDSENSILRETEESVEINSEIKPAKNPSAIKVIDLEISREEILEHTTDPMSLVIAARPMPYTNPKTGKLAGVIISEIDDSLPAHNLSGLQKNDVILSVNKQKLNSVEHALEIGRAMKEDYLTIERVDVEILRDGRSLLLKYKIF